MEAVFDIEGDGLVPTKIHCLCANSKEEGPQSYTSYDDMRAFLSRAKTLVGHNIQRFDIPVLERILGVDLSKHTIVDTLALSWYLQPKRSFHSLDSYGTEFLIFKPKVEDWENLPIEDYIHRCSEDVRINTRLWNDQHKYLKKLYPNDNDLWRCVKYLSFKLYCARLQEQSQWKLNVEHVQTALEKLAKDRDERVEKLSAVLPKIPVLATRTKPKVFFNKAKELTARGRAWLELLSEYNLPDDTQEFEVVVGYNPPNPTSHQQVKDWLFSLGWTPKTFEYKKDSEGKEKAIPQINQKFGKGLDPGIIDLIEDHPELEFLKGLSVLNHRISVLEGFLTNQRDGYVKAAVNGLTNTLRFQHIAPCVNLPKTDRLYASEIRTALVSREGYEQCGADMSALEDKLKQHYIFPYDPDFVRSMNQPDWDPHLLVALNGGMLTEEEVAEYKRYKATDGKEGSNKNSKVRDVAKNGGYAMQYGAFPKKLVKTLGVTMEVAQQLFDGYWKLNWAIKKVADTRRIKSVDDQMWVYNEVSGLWYSLRSEKDIFSTTVQGTASYVFDLWVRFLLQERPQLTAQFHDEIVLEIPKGTRESITQLLNTSIQKTNDTLKLNVQLGIGIQFGDNYGQIH